MATKPADFFIGVVDFFAIILPGALLSYLALVAPRQHDLGVITLPREGTAQGWVRLRAVVLSVGSFRIPHRGSLPRPPL